MGQDVESLDLLDPGEVLVDFSMCCSSVSRTSGLPTIAPGSSSMPCRQRRGQRFLIERDQGDQVGRRSPITTHWGDQRMPLDFRSMLTGVMFLPPAVMMISLRPMIET